MVRIQEIMVRMEIWDGRSCELVKVGVGRIDTFCEVQLSWWKKIVMGAT